MWFSTVVWQDDVQMTAEGFFLSAVNPTSPIDYETVSGGSPDGAVYFGLRAGTWIKVAVVSALMAALFRFNLSRLWLKTNPINGEANWGHSMIIPFIGIYYLYVHRDQLLAARVKTAWEGLGIMFFGVVAFVYGIYPGQNDYLKDLGMVITLFGVVLFMCGWQVMKIAWFPILFLVCAIPWPGLVYSWIAGPLQRLAAQVAVMVLQITGVDASVGGTKIFIQKLNGPSRTLNVAEACAGLRSLMTFISIGTAIAFLSDRALWAKILISVSSVPIAILCNVMRVSGQGLLDHYVSEKWSESFAHQFAGLVMLIPAFFLILLVGWFVDRLVIEEVDEKSKNYTRDSLVVSKGPAIGSAPLASAARTTVTASRAVPAAVPPSPRALAAQRRTPGPGNVSRPPAQKPVAAKPTAPKPSSQNRTAPNSGESK